MLKKPGDDQKVAMKKDSVVFNLMNVINEAALSKLRAMRLFINCRKRKLRQYNNAVRKGNNCGNLHSAG